jgi:hypothetical protein
MRPRYWKNNALCFPDKENDDRREAVILFIDCRFGNGKSSKCGGGNPQSSDGISARAGYYAFNKKQE